MSETAITVRVVETGDSAEARSPEAALLAAFTLGWDVKHAAGTQGFDPTLVFEVDGEVVRSASLRTLERMS